MMAGAAGRYAGMCYPVGSTSVSKAATKGCVAAARSWLTRGVSAARLRNRCLALIGRMRRRVGWRVILGRGASIVVRSANGRMTVGSQSTTARVSVMFRTPFHRTARSHQMSLHIALAARLHSMFCSRSLEQTALHRYRIARKLAKRYLPVGISANKSATRARAGHVLKGSKSLVAAGGRLLKVSVIRAWRSHHAVPACAVRPSTAAGMNAVNAAVPVRRKPVNVKR